MHIIEIRKKSGGVRTIYAPSKSEKRKYRRMIPGLNKLLELHCKPLPCHGFMPNRSPVTNAKAHVGFQWSLSFDLKDFFDSVKAHHLQLVPEKWRAGLLYEGAARQGLPTSPLVANLAAVLMDKAIIAGISSKVVYTRYADDLTFSGDSREELDAIRTWLPQVVKDHKFEINPKKTRLQSAKFGRRVITGVAVDDAGIHPTREVRRRLRAAIHQNHTEEAAGLAEWCSLKPPGLVSNREKRRQANTVKRALRKAGM